MSGVRRNAILRLLRVDEWTQLAGGVGDRKRVVVDPPVAGSELALLDDGRAFVAEVSVTGDRDGKHRQQHDRQRDGVQPQGRRHDPVQHPAGPCRFPSRRTLLVGWSRHVTSDTAGTAALSSPPGPL
jgi:hypothetical protein